MPKRQAKGKKQGKKAVKPAKGKVARAEAWKGTRAAWKDEPRIERAEFDEEMEKLQVELVKLQEWVKVSGAKICVVFEGRDTAGKGSLIRRITERVSPRVFRVVALSAPTEREKSQMYFQRYMAHLPAAGEVVLFDRSWYNRAGVERVMGFAAEAQVEEFLKNVPLVENAMIDLGIILIKYWLEVSEEEQAKRFDERNTDPRKIWKLSPMDLEAQARSVRLLAGTRRHVRRNRHGEISLVRRSVRRSAPGSPELHRPHAQPDPVQEGAAREDQVPQATEAG